MMGEEVLTRNDYTIGWVTALAIERAAAVAVLDEKHPQLPMGAGDNNNYSFGRIKNHNIVITSLPDDGYGKANAAFVALNMYRTFPSLQEFLMVGIAGGAPINADVRLGDVVVSTKIHEYDLGKALSEGRFEPTAIQLRPSQGLRMAVTALRADHESQPSRIPSILSQMAKDNQHMERYASRKSLQDNLFDSGYAHPESARSCDNCDRSKLVKREKRNDDHPRIHYGIIASGDQVIKSAETRDKLAKRCNALCFEMEAAGFTESLQCLVIRSICDYSDSHKNDQWQRYAAATAAAYTKELLCVMASPEVTKSRVDKGLYEKGALMKSLEFPSILSRELNIDLPHNNTCRWILSHPVYLEWLDPDMVSAHHRFLWIRGKPGAGKSTLMKFISKNISNRGQTVVSFFFNARGESLEKSTEGCYRSLLYQLLEKVPGLAVPRTPHLLKASTGSITWHISILQDALLRVVSQLGQAEVMLFIDALDECNRSEVYNKVKYFEQLGKTAMERNIKLFTCFSSRHYPSIPIKTNLTFVVEDQMGHNNDLESYIMDNLDVGDGESAHAVRWALLNKAAGVFMWAVLVIRMLNQGYLEGRIRELKHRVDSLPNKLSDLFKNILENDKENEAEFALSIQWILYAKRPLRIEEYYYAMAAGLYLRKAELGEWDENEVTKADMRRYVSSSSKGLAETIASGSLVRVQFIHESVREFFTTKNGGVYDIWPERTDWGETQSHDRLKECCYAYLQARSSDLVKQFDKCDLLQDDLWWEVWEEKVEAFPFTNYAVAQVLFHAEMAASDFPQRDFLKSFDLRSWITLYNRVNRSYRAIFTLSANMFYVLASQNYPRLISAATDYDPVIHVHGEAYEYPLFVALSFGLSHKDAVDTILRIGGYRSDANNLLPQGWESKPVGRHTPLTLAAKWGHEGLMKILLDKGVDANEASPDGRRPLEVAIQHRQQGAIRLLLGRGASARYSAPTFEDDLYNIVQFIVNLGDFNSTKFLSCASKGRRLNMIRLILEENARVDSKGVERLPPFGYAVEQWAFDIEEESMREEGCKNTSRFKPNSGMPEIVQLLLDKGAQVNSRDAWGMSPLHYAAMAGHDDTATVLLQSGAQVNLRDATGRSPLHYAARTGFVRTVTVLLQGGAEVDSRDLRGMSPLYYAARAGFVRTVTVLLQYGAEVDSRDPRGMSPLYYAARAGFIRTATVLLQGGAYVDCRDARGMSPLHHAARAGFFRTVTVLLQGGAEVDSRDLRGMSPLHYAAAAGRVNTATVLLQEDARAMLRSEEGRTPLSYAVRYGQSDIVRLLLPPGTRMHLRGRTLMTPLKFAAEYIGRIYEFQKIVQTFGLDAPNHWTFRTGGEFRIESYRPWLHKRRQGRSCWKRYIRGQMPPPSTVLTLPDPKLLSWLR